MKSQVALYNNLRPKDSLKYITKPIYNRCAKK